MKFKDLPSAFAKGRDILRSLKGKYHDLDAYLVVASHLGQARITDRHLECLDKFPALFVESENKTLALEALADFKKVKKHAEGADGEIKAEVGIVLSLLTARIDELEIDDSVRIELRFEELRYALVEKLQKDSLVDRELTPQSKASIRIVIGTLGSLSGT